MANRESGPRRAFGSIAQVRCEQAIADSADLRGLGRGFSSRGPFAAVVRVNSRWFAIRRWELCASRDLRRSDATQTMSTILRNAQLQTIYRGFRGSTRTTAANLSWGGNYCFVAKAAAAASSASAARGF